MSESFISIAEAVQLTGKSRRTIQRLVESLVKKQLDQVMKEKTDRGYIWKLDKQALQQAYGVSGSSASDASPVSSPPPLARPEVPARSETYLEVALHGYRGMMAMHQEVKQVYGERLKEKDDHIAALTQELTRSKRDFGPGYWAADRCVFRRDQKFGKFLFLG